MATAASRRHYARFDFMMLFKELESLLIHSLMPFLIPPLLVPFSLLCRLIFICQKMLAQEAALKRQRRERAAAQLRRARGEAMMRYSSAEQSRGARRCAYAARRGVICGRRAKARILE